MTFTNDATGMRYRRKTKTRLKKREKKRPSKKPFRSQLVG
jgi:hypothetical protein